MSILNKIPLLVQNSCFLPYSFLNPKSSMCLLSFFPWTSFCQLPYSHVVSREASPSRKKESLAQTRAFLCFSAVEQFPEACLWNWLVPSVLTLTSHDLPWRSLGLTLLLSWLQFKPSNQIWMVWLVYWFSDPGRLISSRPAASLQILSHTWDLLNPRL